MARKVYVFWDNSNIFIGAQKTFEVVGRAYPKGARIEFGNLMKLAHANRQVGGGFCVGSVPPELARVWEAMRKKTGIRLELFERGADSRTEQAVDQALQVHMLRAMTDEAYPQIAVLLTGDGKGYRGGIGFHADLERMHKKGWGIEVVSWEHVCAGALRNWAEQAGRFIKLDDWIESIVFEQGVTTAKPLDLRRRPKV
jgi:hypothetical protein